MLARALALAAVASAVLALPAHAASVSVSTTRSLAQLIAAPGEANAITVTIVGTSFTDAHDAAPYDVLVRDDGAPLTPASGCVALDVHAARCDFVASVEIDSGDGDDTVAIAGIAARIAAGAGADHVVTAVGLISTVDAGDGDDVVDGHDGDMIDGGAGDDVMTATRAVLEGGSGNDQISGSGTLVGGDGDDTLTAGAGDDGLEGGPGNDLLSGGAGDDVLDGDGVPPSPAPATPATDTLGDDRIDGGAGDDQVVYSSHSAGVRVDLASGRGGSTGEHDVLTSIENVDGSPGPDRLLGDGGPNHLNGEKGHDVLAGRGGDDELAGGYGDAADQLSGGAGDDSLWGRPHDRVNCGSGTDLLADRSTTTVIDLSCEQLKLRTSRWVAAVTLSPQGVRAFVACAHTCGGSLVVRSGSATLARQRLTRRRSGRLAVRFAHHGAHVTGELRATFGGEHDGVRLRL